MRTAVPRLENVRVELFAPSFDWLFQNPTCIGVFVDIFWPTGHEHTAGFRISCRKISKMVILAGLGFHKSAFIRRACTATNLSR